MKNHSGVLNHIAIIPDGNRRWAKERRLPTFEGHRRGFKSIRKLANYIRKIGISTFTVWAFSTENWNRTKEEIAYLMNIYENWIDKDLKTALKEQIRIVHLGRKDRIPKTLREKLEEAEAKTQKFTKYYLGIALDYGGRDEMLRAFHRMQRAKIKQQREEDIDKYLDTAQMPYPNPDLIIRTSGEYRTSGFLPWQGAYSEYIFSKKYLPDFTVEDLKQAIEEYNIRQRRYGK